MLRAEDWGAVGSVDRLSWHGGARSRQLAWLSGHGGACWSHPAPHLRGGRGCSWEPRPEQAGGVLDARQQVRRAGDRRRGHQCPEPASEVGEAASAGDSAPPPSSCPSGSSPCGLTGTALAGPLCPPWPLLCASANGWGRLGTLVAPGAGVLARCSPNAFSRVTI